MVEALAAIVRTKVCNRQSDCSERTGFEHQGTTSRVDAGRQTRADDGFGNLRIGRLLEARDRVQVCKIVIVNRGYREVLSTIEGSKIDRSNAIEESGLTR